VNPVPDPLLLRKSGSAGNRNSCTAYVRGLYRVHQEPLCVIHEPVFGYNSYHPDVTPNVSVVTQTIRVSVAVLLNLVQGNISHSLASYPSALPERPFTHNTT
jgi:hypothetical protein